MTENAEPSGDAPTFGPRCFLCGIEAPAPFGTPAGRWVRCGGCGLVRQQDPPPVAITQKQYGFSQRHGEPRPEIWDAMAARPHDLFKYWVIGEALAAAGLSGRLVDVGCGSGHMQRYLTSLGWETVGVEPSGNPLGREKLNLEIYNEPLETFLGRPDRAASFDVALLHHVIEHSYEPSRLLRQVRALVRPGGHALIATPNLRGLSMRWKTLSSRLGWKARPFRHLDYPKHLVLFDLKNLPRLVQGAGFDVVDVQTYTRASGDGAAHPRRFGFWDRLAFGDNMWVIARRSGD